MMKMDTLTPEGPAVDRVLDVKGLNCPLPILRTRIALGEIEPGQILRVLATDPHSVIDFRAFCARTGHDLVRLVRQDELFEFYIRRE